MTNKPKDESKPGDPAAAPMPKMRVKQVPIAKLVPYARNARQHPSRQIAGIAASIREYGFNAPVLVDGENGIIAGHARVLAAETIGMKRVDRTLPPHRKVEARLHPGRQLPGRIRALGVDDGARRGAAAQRHGRDAAAAGWHDAPAAGLGQAKVAGIARTEIARE